MSWNRRLKLGELGEKMAEQWFLNNGWKMIRTQPAIEILGVKPGKKYGMIYTVRMKSRGGVADYTGYEFFRAIPGLQVDGGDGPLYRACEVKEATGDTMPASRLDKDQRAFLASLPIGCAWVGIFWTDTNEFIMHEFIAKGSYKR